MSSLLYLCVMYSTLPDCIFTWLGLVKWRDANTYRRTLILNCNGTSFFSIYSDKWIKRRKVRKEGGKKISAQSSNDDDDYDDDDALLT